MFIKFLVAHTAGIKAGTVANYDPTTGARLVSEGVAELSDAKGWEAYKAEAKQAREDAQTAYVESVTKENLARIERAKEEAKKPKALTDAEKVKLLENELATARETITALEAKLSAIEKPAKK